MEWDLIVHREDKFLEVITGGVADSDGSLGMAKAISEAMRNNRITKVIIDHRNLAGVSGNVIEIYKRPKILSLIGVILGVKIAEIVRPEHQDHFRFLETVCVNRGFRFSIFQEKGPAMEWLLK